MVKERAAIGNADDEVAMVMLGRGSYKVTATDEALAPADSAGRIAVRFA